MRAKEVLNAVSGHDYSYPFMEPVDTATHRVSQGTTHSLSSILTQASPSSIIPKIAG